MTTTTENPLALLGQSIAVPRAFHPIMEAQTSSPMQANVGQSFAVISIKGKVFGIKYGGETHQLMMNFNGQQIVAPWFDVVLVKAKAELSKTWYKEGYQDGSEEAPTCWSEDGITPLAPLDQRPIDERTGGPCTDCRMCPMNVFGSKVSDIGSRGKACADTRKVIVLPLAPTGQLNAQGIDPGVLDSENIKFGGAMLLRVPAASLRPGAEYDQKLMQMGIPHYAVVTRLSFDQKEAYPKFEFKALRMLTDAEAEKIIECQNGMQAKQILESSMVGASSPAPTSGDPGLIAANVPAAMQTQPGAPTASDMQQQPSAKVVPIHGAQVAAQPVHSTAPPPQVATVAPVKQMTEKAQGFSYEDYIGKGWTEAQLIEHGMMLAPAAAVVPPTGPGPDPSNGINVNPGLFQTVEGLLGK